MIDIHTVQTSASWPDLCPLGIPFPEETTNYRCKISARGPFASIDEIVAPRASSASPHTVERLSSSGPITLKISPKPDPNPASLYDENEKDCGVPRGKIVVCSRRPRNPEPHDEWYVLSAMNIKMRHYPDFAAAIGMKCVHNCAEARAYMKAYREYSRLHPGFDVNQPLDPRPPFPPPVADSGTPPFYP
jgi:hypothetical protein